MLLDSMTETDEAERVARCLNNTDDLVNKHGQQNRNKAVLTYIPGVFTAFDNNAGSRA
jgi:hypothetical protein